MLAIETSIVLRDGKPAVLLQLPYGHVVMWPDDARQVAAQITMSAEDADNMKR